MAPGGARGVTDRASILAEIVELNSVPTREDDEFTTAEYGAALAAKGVLLTDEGCLYRLQKLVKERKLTTRLAFVLEKQRTCRVWRKGEKDGV